MRPVMASVFYLFSATASLCFPVIADAGRPLVIDDAPPVAPGNLEVELGFSQAQPHGGGRDQAGPVATVAYGLIDRIELGLSIQRINQDSRNEAPLKGFEDLHLTTKILAVAESPVLPAVSLSLDIKLPTANRRKGLTTGKSDQDLMLILTKSFAPLAAHLNFGYRIVNSPRDAKLKNVLHGGIAADWAFRPQWTLVGEIFGSSREAKGERNDAAFQLGLSYAVIAGLVLDAAMGRSFRSEATQVEGTVGLTWTWDVLKALKGQP